MGTVLGKKPNLVAVQSYEVVMTINLPKYAEDYDVTLADALKEARDRVEIALIEGAKQTIGTAHWGADWLGLSVRRMESVDVATRIKG